MIALDRHRHLAPPPAVKLATRPVLRALKLEAFLSVRDVFDLGAGALANLVASGRITPEQWEASMRDLVKDTHVAAYASGRSGRWNQIGPREWGHVGASVRAQYGYLSRFGRALLDDDIDEDKIYQRSRLYGAAARMSFERAAMADLGLETELPAYPGDGTTDCLVNCKCRWSVRVLSKRRGDFNVSWRLGTAEHCLQCRTRSKKWKSLQVRGGRLVSGYAVDGCFR